MFYESCSRQLENEADSYSDESFEDLSSEEERTPTFEFNMTPPSIGNSGCGDSNNTMDEGRLLRCGQQQEATASDVSDIEDHHEVSFEESSQSICKGELQEQQSARKFFDDVSSAGGQEVLEDEELHHQEFFERNNEQKVIDDDELNRVDEVVFGLLQSAEQSPRVNNNKGTSYQSDAKLVKGEDCVQELYPSMDRGNGSRKKKVRFASEPEVFEVPFSSREFGEPYFDVTDDKSPDEAQSDSLLKNVNLDPYSQEFVDDLENLLDDIEEDIREEPDDNILDLVPGTRPVCKQEKENYCSERTSSVENSGSEIDLEKEISFPSKMQVAGSNELAEYSMTADLLLCENENTPRAVSVNTLQRNHTQEKDFASSGQTTAEAIPQTNRGGAESHTQVEDTSDLAMLNKKEVIMVSNSYSDERMDKDDKFSMWETTKSQEDSESAIGHQYEAESPMSSNADFGPNSRPNPGVETTARPNTSVCQEKMVSNSKQFCLKDTDDRRKRGQTNIVDICERLKSGRSLVYKESEDNRVKHNSVSETCDGNKSESRLPKEDITSFRCETEEKMDDGNRDKKDQIVDNTSVVKAELKDIATELEHLKNLHARMSHIHGALNGGEKSDYDMPFLRETTYQGRLSLLEQFRIIMFSVTETSEDIKTALVQVLEDSTQNNISLEHELAQMKREYYETLDKRNEEIKSLKECNEELKLQLEEGDQKLRTIECIIASVNIENEKLLDQNDDLEDELKRALSEKNDILEELDRKHSKEEDRERELSNLKDNMRWKSLNLEEIYAAWDQMCTDKEKLEDDLGFVTVSLEKSEAAKLELAKQMKEMKIILENSKKEQRSKNYTVDYAYLREEVEHLKGSLVLSNLEKERLKMELYSIANASPIRNDGEEFGHQKELFKSRNEKEISELEMQNSVILQNLAHPSEILNAKGYSKTNVTSTEEEYFRTAFTQLEKQLKGVQDELSQLRNENVHSQRQGKRKRKAQFRGIKKMLVCNDENIKSLAQSLQLDMKELNKEFEQDINRQIRNDIQEHLGVALKQGIGNQPKIEKGQDNEIKELKRLLERAITSVEKNERMVIEKENCEKSQELDDKVQELHKLLQETKLHLESNEKKLNEADHTVEELNRQLYKERKNKDEQLMDKEGEVNKLQRLLSDSDKNTETLHGRLSEISKQLEDAKDILSQKETELANSKASLFDADDLLTTSRQYIIEMQRELEETKGVLKEKCVALKYTERYAEVLCKSTRRNDFEIGAMTSELINKVERAVKRVGKCLQKKTALKAYEYKEGESAKEVADERPNDLNEADSHQIQFTLLKEKEKKLEDLESATVHLKGDLDCPSNTSLKDKDNELQQLKSELQRNKIKIKDLESSINEMKQDLVLSNNSLKQRGNELHQTRSELKGKDMEIKDLESSIRELKQNLESSNASLKQRDNELHQTRSELQEKDMEIKVLESSISELKQNLESSNASLKQRGNELQQTRSELQEKDMEIKDLESSISELKQDLVLSNNSLKQRDNELHQTRSELKGKDMEVKDLESSISGLKQDLELSNASLKQRDNELQQTRSELQGKNMEIKDFESSICALKENLQRNEMELKAAKERCNMLEEDRNSLQSELMELKTHLSQQDGEIKEMKRLTFTKDSDLREGSLEMEKLQLQLSKEEQKIELLEHGLSTKENEINRMTENLQNKLFEIIRLEKTLENAKIENCKTSQAYQMKTSYLEALVAGLKKDLEGQSVLLCVKDKELTKANLGIQLKEREGDGLKSRLRQLEERFQLYKQISTESEFKLAKEKKVLEENATYSETHPGQKGNEIKWNESEKMDNSQKESKREDKEIEKGENPDVVMAQLAGEQIAVAMTDRIQQMMADMNAMQAELENKRGENAKLFTDNKELKEQVNKLQKEADEQQQLSSQKLKNTLDHVRMKRVEIRRLKALQNISSDVSSKVGLLLCVSFQLFIYLFIYCLPFLLIC